MSALVQAVRLPLINSSALSLLTFKSPHIAAKGFGTYGLLNQSASLISSSKNPAIFCTAAMQSQRRSPGCKCRLAILACNTEPGSPQARTLS